MARNRTQCARPRSPSVPAFKLAYKSPPRHKLNRAKAQPASRAYRPLRTIPEDAHKSGFSYKVFHDDDHTRQQFQEACGEDGEDGNDLFEWEEETTLVAALMQEECDFFSRIYAYNVAQPHQDLPMTSYSASCMN